MKSSPLTAALAATRRALLRAERELGTEADIPLTVRRAHLAAESAIQDAITATTKAQEQSAAHDATVRPVAGRKGPRLIFPAPKKSEPINVIIRTV